ncbi:MAG: GNAT family N-acetyltransferase [Candidatus Altimarinota bacterium]
MNNNPLNLAVCRVGKKMRAEARQFCLEQIKQEYGYDYVPQWHADLDSLLDKVGMYSSVNKGVFLAALIENNLVGTIGMRDLKYKPLLWEEYSKAIGSKKIASIWRTYTAKEFRGLGIASYLLEKAEKEALKWDYECIYLHTSLNKADSVKFWSKRGYQIFKEDQNADKTIHMLKKLQN